MSDSSTAGEVAHLEAETVFKRRGYIVLDPLGHEQPYDFVAEKDGFFTRVQVKNGRLQENGAIDVHVCTYGSGVGGVQTYTKEDIDVFAVYCPSLDQVYLVDVEDAPEQNMRLHTSNAEHYATRDAAEHEAERVLGP